MTSQPSRGTHLCLVQVVLLLLAVLPARAQFIDQFDGPALTAWTYLTGDGQAEIDVKLRNGYASVYVDATHDRYNIWWALVKREVSADLELELLKQPGHELRIEARVRPSNAPRRINLHLNTQKTVDFHTHLMEFDLPDTTAWHTISMTTRGFEAEPGDTVNGQLALIDWGVGRYRLDIDYFRVDVVNRDTAGPDLGEPLPYHPPIPDPLSFDLHIPVIEDAVVSAEHPNLNFGDWYAVSDSVRTPALTAGGSQFAILRWDLDRYAGREPTGHGLLELSPLFVARTDSELEELGQIRVVEILGGDPDWTGDSVTLENLSQGLPLEDVFNTQMIIDVAIEEPLRASTLITISRPVLRRMLAGRTRGLLLRPLGAISATFFSKEHDEGSRAARLHFTLIE